MNKYDIIFLFGALFLLAGAILYIAYPTIAPYIFSVGVLAIIVVRVITAYSGHDFRLKHLSRMQQIATILYVPAAYCMFIQSQYWILILVVSAVIEIVVAFRSRSYNGEE